MGLELFPALCIALDVSMNNGIYLSEELQDTIHQGQVTTYAYLYKVIRQRGPEEC